MASTLEKDWATFRQYRLQKICVEEEAGYIRFRQRNPVAHKANSPIRKRAKLILAALWAISIAYVATIAILPVTLIYAMLSAGPFFLVLLIVFRFFGGETVVEVRPGTVTIDNSEKRRHIKAEEIKNIEVRAGQHGFDILIWHGPVAIQTVFQENQPDAIALKEAMAIAMGLMNQRQTVNAPKRARTFDE